MVHAPSKCPSSQPNGAAAWRNREQTLCASQPPPLPATAG
eukprot:CAMPEP_0206257080 /NCGR_PEP_ID=MMETSP0047_2-20121206/25133_1 /ASSEMBLY_ACC=CAM_ASM_000192 /TAXON_ID=195065 /ORGANISM="Chroomonas mesostigmatica_cf, Strain CCMP1168" /LENGTH=39 /DNA_ID= /DNA_START= /DNA_END= /DNA_ORIENTATION=